MDSDGVEFSMQWKGGTSSSENDRGQMGQLLLLLNVFDLSATFREGGKGMIMTIGMKDHINAKKHKKEKKEDGSIPSGPPSSSTLNSIKKTFLEGTTPDDSTFSRRRFCAMIQKLVFNSRKRRTTLILIL
ncbi:hypothetical protein K1719_014272 [Acacia pycnantha]|nr:hypothetical protein K1719_014272 [Acacia pycnantha]